MTEIHLGTGWKGSTLIAFATGIPYSLRERMRRKIAPGFGDSPERKVRGERDRSGQLDKVHRGARDGVLWSETKQRSILQSI